MERTFTDPMTETKGFPEEVRPASTASGVIQMLTWTGIPHPEQGAWAMIPETSPGA